MARASRPPASPLYPEIEPYRTGRLRVSDVHTLYFEESGNPKGKPVVFLHGGPGGGTDPNQRRYFDPRRYRIVLFDQRGCGKSRPHANLVDNTTWHLVSDIEALREHLGIDRWQVFGGSWGSTLALAYAQTHPTRVTELVLRGIFLCRKQEIDWFYQDPNGAAALFPDLWDEYVAPIPPAERGDMVRAYYRRLTSKHRATMQRAARTWTLWEGGTSYLRTNATTLARYRRSNFSTAFARIECHYFTNGAFLQSDDQLLRNVNRIRKIPAVIIQGRYDVVCPMRSAWDLHKAWPEAGFQVVPDAGHSANEPGIAAELVKATDAFAGRTAAARRRRR
jgi:proline iminopeptidase